MIRQQLGRERVLPGENEAMSDVMRIEHLGGSSLSRRSLLEKTALSGGALALAALGWPAGATAQEQDAAREEEAALLRGHGVEIPETNVRFGMSAFGDHNIYAIGILNGWFRDVGITLGPGTFGVRSLSPQVISRFVSNEVDIHTWYGPLQIEIMARVPQVKLFTFSDTYVGTYMLASPNTGAKSVSQLVAGGMPFETALQQAMAQMKGKRVAIDNTGSHRIFFDTITHLGGVSFEDVQLSVLEDARIVFLGRGGNIDFASPAGAIQNVNLIQEGWYPLVSIEDLIRGLPQGDYRGVGSIGHTGLATTDAYREANPDTILRMTGVMFRIIDAIHVDLANGTDHALKLEVPVIEAAAGTEIGVEGLRTVFSTLDPLKSFEQQSEYWLETNNPFYYLNVYNPQIKAAQEGGLLPKDRSFSPDDAIVAPQIYRQLVTYRTEYDDMKRKAVDLGADRMKLVAIAQKHYDQRNYLDAHRILAVALKT
jgi:ABC-type nitrate/sulfonate/bicarbonate transport system substrate-binding protein